MAEAKKKDQKVEIRTLKRVVLSVRLVGIAPLYTHAASPSALDAIIAKRTALIPREVTEQKKNIDPVAQYESGLHIISKDPPRYGLRSVAFKNAILETGTQLNFTKTLMNNVIWISGARYPYSRHSLVEIIPAQGDEGAPRMIQDEVRIGGRGPGTGSMDPRWRPLWLPGWSVVLDVVFPESLLPKKTLLEMIIEAGISQGVGDRRIGKSGDEYGQWIIDHKQPMKIKMMPYAKWASGHIEDMRRSIDGPAWEDQRPYWQALLAKSKAESTRE